jgi:hypothetical protein
VDVGNVTGILKVHAACPREHRWLGYLHRFRRRKGSVGIETCYVLDGRISIPTKDSCG